VALLHIASILHVTFKNPVPLIRAEKEVVVLKSIHEVFHKFSTSDKGISQAEADSRLKHYGQNFIHEKKKTHIIWKFFGQVKNLFALLLLIATILAYLIGAYPLAVAIFWIIIINATVGFIQEYRAEKAVDALRRILPSYSKVLRAGKEARILSKEVVPGDVLILEEGDNIPADAYLFEAFEMSVNNATLTGESHPKKKSLEFSEEIPKTERHNMVLAGTSVMTGYGKAVVVATGMNTEFGKVAHMTLEIEDEPSPMQIEVAKAAKVDAIVSLGVAFVFFLIGLYMHLGIFETFLFGLGVFVALIPEGLQATISVALAMGVQRMAKKKAIIKRLSAVETLGSTTVICTDKTGTITKAEMTVKEVFIGNKDIHVGGVGYKPEGDFSIDGKKLHNDVFRKHYGLFLEAISFCNNSKVLHPSEPKHEWGIVGSPTEGALLVMAHKAGFDYRRELELNKRVYEIAFSHERKRMTSVHKMKDGERIAFVKGSPKEIINLCKKFWKDGREVELNHAQREALIRKNDEYADEGLRVIGIAYRRMHDGSKRAEDVESNLTFMGLVGIIDPPREDVAGAIKKAKEAGIRIIMITGDYERTAKSIAKKVGLVTTDRPTVLTGKDLHEMNDHDLSNVLKNDELVFARVSPEHKLRIVTLLKKQGEIVAVTGDGVNDAPALRKANIGVAMGISGTDVAKEAADMVLMDDNLATIINAIEEGRAVYDNIKKFTTYIFTSNWPELFPFIAFFIWKIPLALLVIQILCIDLATDVLPSLALGVERPEPDIMKRKPRDRRDHIIGLKVLTRSFFLGIFETVGSLGGCLLVWVMGGWVYGDVMLESNPVYRAGITVTLAAVICNQIANVFACKSERNSIFKIGFFRNKWILWAILGQLTIICALIYIPWIRDVFNMYPIGPIHWLIAFSFAPVLFFAEEGRKLVVRHLERKHVVVKV